MRTYLIIIFFFCSSPYLRADKGDPKTKKEFLKHKLKAGGKLEYPLTMFNKDKEKFSWQEDIEIIKIGKCKIDKTDNYRNNLPFNLDIQNWSKLNSCAFR